MIDAAALLKSLQALLRRLEDDLREQIDERPELDASLRAEHAAADEAGRTAQGYAAWREEPITQRLRRRRSLRPAAQSRHDSICRT
jgi:hypothetical protein